MKNAFSNAFSWEVYYMNSSTGGNPMSSQESGGVGFEQNGSTLQLWIHIGGSYKTINTITINSGQYYHIVATYDKTAGKVKIYADGSIVNETAVSGNFGFPATGAQWIGIGADANASGGQFPLGGEVAIARMYGKVLSRDEVALLYADRIYTPPTNISDIPTDGYTISTEGKTIYVKGLPSSAVVSVYNLLGEKHAVA